jgi:suppressor for copper-sensitivity B
LGLALLGTSGWLLSVLALEGGLGVSLLAGGILAALLAALAWRHHLPPGRRVRRTIEPIAIALAAMAVLVPSLHGLAVPVESARSSGETGHWRPFDEAAVHRMVADERIVLVDVTAAWCLTCKVNELAVLDRPPVSERLRGSDVITMRADWTRPDPAVTAYLQSFGRYGVPLDVLYGPGAPRGIALPELLTSEAVMDAFRRAAAGDPRNQEAIE